MRRRKICAAVNKEKRFRRAGERLKSIPIF